MPAYIFIDKATREKIKTDADTGKRIAAVEIRYIDWVIEEDGKFGNRDWEVRVSRPVDDRMVTERQAAIGVALRRNKKEENCYLQF